jgi:GT2 family glycosyltransferase
LPGVGLCRYVAGVETSATAPPSPRVCVAFLLYNAAREVDGLVSSLVRQRHPAIERQSDWLEAVFVDDASRDGTAEAVRRALAACGAPSQYRLVAHAANQGLAGTLNELFESVQAPFLLTCHLDCRFGGDDYVAALVELARARPEAAAITGQPVLPAGDALPFAEKLNVVANLMDVLPERASAELVPVGFAEGRCDVFRVEAVRAVGSYDEHLRVSGEDQVLAARLRAKGYAIYKAPRLEYRLSVSAEQDSVAKLVRHQRLFGRTTPYILLAVEGSLGGLVGASASANRTQRAALRAAQLAGAAGLAGGAVSLVVGWPVWPWAALLGLGFALKLTLQHRHLRLVGFRSGEWLAYLALQPLLDLAFAEGVLEGLAGLARKRGKPIG